jgi:hypothetical protein
MHCIQAHATEDVAHARASLAPVPRLGSMLLGRLDHRQRQLPQQRVIIVQQRAVDCDALLPGGIRQPLSHPSAMGCGGDLLAPLGQIVLTVGWLDMGQPLRPLPQERHPPPQPGTGGPQLCGRDVGWRPHAATPPHGNFWGGDRGMFGRPPVDGFHGQGMPEDKRQALPRTQVGPPGPGEEACDSKHALFPIRGNRLAQGSRAGGHMARHYDLTILVHNTDGPGGGHAGQCRRKMEAVWWSIA